MDKLKVGETAVIDPEDVSGVITSASNDVLLKFIDRRHPTYQSKETHWTFLQSCYDGGRDWFTTDNIFRYIKEGDTEYQERLKRAYRFNHSREVVDLVNKYLFKQNILRNLDDAPESVREFWKQASKTGIGIDDMARQMSLRASIQGRIAIVIDTNNSVKILTKQEQKEFGVRIYSYIVSPEQLLDYAFDEKGELMWVKIAEVKRDDGDPIYSSGEEYLQYRLWTRNDWTLFRVVKKRGKRKVEIVDRGEHNLGVVPVVLLDNVISDSTYDSPALIDEIAYLDRAVANYLSNLDAIIQDQTFSQLVMPAQAILPGEDGYQKMVEMGTKRIFLYDGQGGAAPSYLSPDVKQAELIISVINKIINEIYHTVGLAGERTKQDNAVGIDNSSGVAKAYDFEKVNALLSAKAHSLENAENSINRIVALWSGDKIKDDLVSYPDDFDTRGLYDEFDIAARLALIDAPDGIRQEQMKTLLDKLFPQIKKELRERLEKEIESWPAQEVEATPNGEVVKKPGFQGAVGPEKQKPAG